MECRVTTLLISEVGRFGESRESEGGPPARSLQRHGQRPRGDEQAGRRAPLNPTMWPPCLTSMGEGVLAG
jgi:hypothetical protein